MKILDVPQAGKCGVIVGQGGRYGQLSIPTRLSTVPTALRSSSPRCGLPVASPSQGIPVQFSPLRAHAARRVFSRSPRAILLSQAPLHGIATVAPRYCYGTTPDPLRMSLLHISSAKRLIVAFLPYETLSSLLFETWHNWVKPLVVAFIVVLCLCKARASTLAHTDG